MSQQPIQSDALAALRVQIDALDKQLLQLVNDRAKVAEQVGEIKRAEGSPFFRPDRVAQVIDKITQANPGPLKNEHIASIWREIMSARLALEAPQRVAVLGPVGTFCEQAAIEYFGSAAELIYCNNFDEVFHATVAGTADRCRRVISRKPIVDARVTAALGAGKSAPDGGARRPGRA
mgnify:CR=1 FL=1